MGSSDRQYRKLLLCISFSIYLSSCGKDLPPAPESSLLKSEDTIVFVGDSITEQGDMRGGYIRLLKDHLNRNYTHFRVNILNAGRSGNKIDDISQRFERDVLRYNPSWVVILIGINDVWQRLDSTKHLNFYLPHFASELDSLVARAQRQNIRVALCTTTVLTEDIYYPGNALLRLYNDEIRRVARNRSCLLIDLNTLFSDVLAKDNRTTQTSNLLTKDGVHLNNRGNRLMASAMLKAFGFGTPQE